MALVTGHKIIEFEGEHYKISNKEDLCQPEQIDEKLTCVKDLVQQFYASGNQRLKNQMIIRFNGRIYFISFACNLNLDQLTKLFLTRKNIEQFKSRDKSFFKNYFGLSISNSSDLNEIKLADMDKVSISFLQYHRNRKIKN